MTTADFSKVRKKYVRSHYLVVVVPLVLDVLPLIEAAAEPRPFLHLFYLGAVAHVAIVSPDEVFIAFFDGHIPQRQSMKRIVVFS